MSLKAIVDQGKKITKQPSIPDSTTAALYFLKKRGYMPKAINANVEAGDVARIEVVFEVYAKADVTLDLMSEFYNAIKNC